MAIYLTADTHFNHQRTLELSRRPFHDLDEMNKVMIAKWNRVVSNQDTVIHLGDFGDPEYAHKLNGSIMLLPGNYERDALKENPKYYSRFENTQVSIMQEGAKVSSQFFNNPTLRDFFKEIKFTHEPIIESAPMKESHICNLFGHIHKLQMVKPYGLNVGTDAHNFEPISVEVVEFYINGILNFYDHSVFK